jgi:transporter family-2 protein
VGIQTPIANLIGQRVGGAASSFIVHVSGTIFSLLVLVANRGENIQTWRGLPWWTFGVGLFGVVLYLCINHTIPRLGASAAVALIIVGQLIAGLTLDHFGLLGVAVRPLDGVRVIGALLLIAGGYLLTR